MTVLFNSVLLAMRAIRRNVLRSSLTVLGIVIGVGAVITMVNAGRGATAQVQAQIASMGSNLLILRPGQKMHGGPRVNAPNFTEGDFRAVSREVPSIIVAAPTASMPITAVYGGENLSTTVTGTDNNLLVVGNWSLSAGRSFTDSDLVGGRAVCLIGSTVRDTLFKSADPIGASIRMKNVSCLVIGLLESKGESMRGDRDSTILVPIRLFWRRFAGNREIDSIHVSARSADLTKEARREVELLMRERRRILAGQPDNFSVRDMQELSDALTGTTQVLTALLSSIAAVSLLVGGIGIMNIMLVSVTERTREIGIRLAIGALERDVMLQFLIESVTLSSIGGFIGIVLSAGGTAIIGRVLGTPFVFDVPIAFLAFVFSGAVGVIFGYFPALKAARMDPIEALRHE